jgi:hypothetical protein
MGKSHDIEDVLSSIRRLVAEGGQERARPAGPGGKPPLMRALEGGTSGGGPSDDRLILEPALRVTEPEDPFQTVADISDGLGAGRKEAVLDDASEAAGQPDVVEVETGEAMRTFWSGSAMSRPHGAEDGPDPFPLPPADLIEDQDEASALFVAGSGSPAPVEPRRPAEPSREDEPDLAAALGQDPEALRTLIADVVREELSGALGERITRNVRKLVRREIRQVLAGDEFD